jgi:hypothetical protein
VTFSNRSRDLAINQGCAAIAEFGLVSVLSNLWPAPDPLPG